MEGTNRGKIDAVDRIILACWCQLRGRTRNLTICWGGLILILLSGCDLSTGNQHRSPAHVAENSTMPTTALNQQIEKPALDRLASPQTVTASFALG